jgi:hypothetical protein
VTQYLMRGFSGYPQESCLAGSMPDYAFDEAAQGCAGTSKMSATRRDPHFGHFKRLSSLASGKEGPRVYSKTTCAPNESRKHKNLPKI